MIFHFSARKRLTDLGFNNIRKESWEKSNASSILREEKPQRIPIDRQIMHNKGEFVFNSWRFLDFFPPFFSAWLCSWDFSGIFIASDGHK